MRLRACKALGIVMLAAAAALAGDLLDRCEYYDELEIPTPEGQLARDLRERLGA